MASEVAGSGTRGWRAGAARAVITPTEDLWLSGYASRDHSAEGKLHDLWIKVLALEDSSGHRAVLVTLDLIGLPRDLSVSVRRRLKEAHGLERAQVALAASHTHTGPIVGSNLEPMYDLSTAAWAAVKRYAAMLEDRIVDEVGLALSRLAPAVVSHGNGRATFAVNRRANPEARVPELRAAGRLQGPQDHDVPVLRVTDQRGTEAVVVFGYACHATVLSSYRWSGDYPGFAQAALERRRPGTIAMFWAGCGADQNPLPRRSVRLATEYGERLADAVEAALAGKLSPIAPAARLATGYREIDLALARIPSREDIERDARSTDRYRAGRARVLLRQLDREGRIPRLYPYPVQVWRLGAGLDWVFLGGEVVVDYSLRIRRELDPSRSWVAAYANDVMGYIPSERVLREGGYEGSTSTVYYGLPSPWAPGLEDRIASTVHELAGTPSARLADPKDRP